jgi:hypothetical protein
MDKNSDYAKTHLNKYARSFLSSLAVPFPYQIILEAKKC